MALPSDYAGQGCSLARTLEVVGERWTLLLLRDAFYGVRRFGDFAAHLGIPRAVLASRLKSLVETGVMARVPGAGAREEYELTDKGAALWPVVRGLMEWGDEHYAPAGPRRVFMHADDDGPVDASGRCAVCGAFPGVQDLVVAPGPGLPPPEGQPDLVTVALATPHRLLQPLRP